MYTVLDSYQRFDQKNNMMMRPNWDPLLKHIGPTTFETKLRHLERNVNGFSLKEYALAASSGILGSSMGADINQPNRAFTSWEKLTLNPYLRLPETKPELIEPEIMTGYIKRAARYFGADLVGIAKLDMRWVYSNHYISETGESKPVDIDPGYRYVIVMAKEMDYDLVRSAPSALHQAVVSLTYSKMAFLVGAVAQFIRTLGYRAIPALNDTGLSVPMAIDAGLGELSRQGLLITPQFGPRQRLCKVITDLPLKPDKPIEFGVAQFCSVCKKCAQACPSQAIYSGEPTAEVTSVSNNAGVVKWPLAAEKCREYFSKIGTNCGVCLRVCPYNKKDNPLHQTARWMTEHAPWIDPLFVKLDDVFGYGKQYNPRFFWNGN